MTLGSGLVITNSEQTDSLTKINIKTREITSELNHPQEIIFSGFKTKDEIKTNLEKQESICGESTTLKNKECVPIEAQKIKTIGDEGISDGGGCLIATASFGSELSIQVQQLRELRDNKLLKTELGSGFIQLFNDIYYSFSPHILQTMKERI